MRTLVLVHAALLLAASGVAAQPAKFRTSTSLVALNVTVTDGKKLVTGLSQDDFEVYENGVRQELRFFDTSDVPLDLILLLDTSSSMRDKLPVVHEAARSFMKVLRPGDRGAVVAFTERVHVMQELTGDAAAIERAIGATTAKGSTSLHTAIYVALKEFGRLALTAADVRRQAIAVLSDGEDTSSGLTIDDVLALARTTGVSIYTIGLQSQAPASRPGLAAWKPQAETAMHALRTLARETGAQSFFPASVHDLKGVYSSIAHELESQYSLAYTPSAGAAAGQFRRILVRVTADPSYRPRTRSGYLVNEPRSFSGESSLR